MRFNLHPDGGHKDPCVFPRITAQSTENFALNLGIPLRITILPIVSKSQVEGHNGSAVSDARMASCFVDFDQRLRVYGKRCHGRRC